MLMFALRKSTVELNRRKVLAQVARQLKIIVACTISMSNINLIKQIGDKSSPLYRKVIMKAKKSIHLAVEQKQKQRFEAPQRVGHFPHEILKVLKETISINVQPSITVRRYVLRRKM